MVSDLNAVSATSATHVLCRVSAAVFSCQFRLILFQAVYTAWQNLKGYDKPDTAAAGITEHY